MALQTLYRAPPKITYVERGSDADDVPPSQQTAGSKGIPVNHTRPGMVPGRTEAAPYATANGVPIVKTTIRSYTEAMAQAPGEDTITLRPAQIRAAMAAIRQNWRDDAAADPVVGGARHKAVVAGAKGVLEAYGRAAGSPRLEDLRNLMNDSGAGDHRAVLHFVDWVGRELGKARAAGSSAARPAAKHGPASSRLYKGGSGNGAVPVRGNVPATKGERLYRNSAPR